MFTTDNKIDTKPTLNDSSLIHLQLEEVDSNKTGIYLNDNFVCDVNYNDSSINVSDCKYNMTTTQQKHIISKVEDFLFESKEDETQETYTSYDDMYGVTKRNVYITPCAWVVLNRFKKDKMTDSEKYLLRKRALTILC